MKKLLVGLAAGTAVIATPALARDGSWYAGLEAGVLLPEDTEFRFQGPESATTDQKMGWDADLIAGYDFGNFRLEAEGAYKTTNTDTLTSDVIGIPGATTALATGTFDAEDSGIKIWSGMINALVDFGGNTGLGAYVGVGAGYASVSADISANAAGPGFVDGSDGSAAVQGIAGVRFPMNDSLDLGLKYRYFAVDNIDLTDSVGRAVEGDFDSHSLLASLVYNFGAAPPPPPLRHRAT